MVLVSFPISSKSSRPLLPAQVSLARLACSRITVQEVVALSDATMDDKLQPRRVTQDARDNVPCTV